MRTLKIFSILSLILLFNFSDTFCQIKIDFSKYRINLLSKSTKFNCTSRRVTIPIDLNNDGLIDFVTTGDDMGPCGTNGEISYLKFFENDGKDNYVENNLKYSKDSLWVIRPDWYLVEDFNGDGKKDIFITGEHIHQQWNNSFLNVYPFIKPNIDIDTSNNYSFIQRRHHLYISQTDGTFKDSPEFLQGMRVGSTFGITAIDYNKDGHIDLINAVQQFSNNDNLYPSGWDIEIFINNGGKSMTRTTPFTVRGALDINNNKFNKSRIDSLGGNSEGPENLKFHDVNNDGYLDMIFNDRSGNALCMLSQNKLLDLYSPIIKFDDFERNGLLTNMPGSTVEIRGFYITDIKKDGTKQLIEHWANGGGDYQPGKKLYQLIKVFEIKNGTFSDATNTYFNSGENIGKNYGAGLLALVDVDQDGFIDLFPRVIDQDGFGNQGYGSDSTMYYRNENGKFILTSLGLKYYFKEFKELADSMKVYKYDTLHRFSIANNLTPINTGKSDKIIFYSFGTEPGIDRSVLSQYTNKYFFNKESQVYNDSLSTYFNGFILSQVNCNIQKPTFSKLKYNLYLKDSIEVKVNNPISNSTYNWEINGVLNQIINTKSKFFKDTATIRVFMTDSVGCTIYSDPVKITNKGLPMNSSYYKNNNTWRTGYQEVHQKIDIDNDGTEDYFFLKLTNNRTIKQVFYGVGSNTLYTNGLYTGSEPADSILKNYKNMISSKIYDSLHYSIPFIYNSKISQLLRPDQFIVNFDKYIDTLLSYNFDVLVTTNINKDAYPDFIALSNNDFLVNQVIIFRSVGKFKYEIKYLPLGWKTSDNRLRYDLATGDINHDGFADIVMTSYTDKNVFDIFYGKDSLGNFQKNSVIDMVSSDDVISKPIHFEIDDLNNDGFDDIIVPQSGYSSNGKTTYLPTRIFLNQNGKLGSPITLDINPKYTITHKIVSSILSDDINEDGLNDIILGLHDDYEVNPPQSVRNYLFQYFENDGKNNFINKSDDKFETGGEIKSIDREGGIAELEARVQYDLDNDGKKEILLSNYIPPSFTPNAYGWVGFPKKYYYFKKNNKDIYALQSSSDSIKFKDTKLDSIFSITNCQFDYGDNSKGTRVNVTPSKTTSLTQNNTPLYIMCERDSLGMKFNLADRYLAKFLLDSSSKKSIGKTSNTLNILTTGKYTPYVIDSFYCVLDMGPEVYVKINPIPINPKITDTAFCQNAIVDSLKVSAINEASILWYGTNITGGTASNISPKPTTGTVGTTSYYLSQKYNSTGCESERVKLSVTIKSLPSSPNINRDSLNNLIANTNGITWYKDGVKIADTTQKIKPTTNGIYTATTTQNGCTSALSQGYYYLTNAVANLINGEYFKVSPNPTSGELNIHYKISSSRNISISVFDINGRAVLLNKKVESGSKVNLGSISKGNYIIQVKDGSGRLITNQKLVKE